MVDLAIVVEVGRLDAMVAGDHKKVSVGIGVVVVGRHKEELGRKLEEHN